MAYKMTDSFKEEDFNEINSLPNELILNIFKFLPLDDIITCEKVCRRWKKLAHDTSLWQKLVIVYSGKPGESEVSALNLDLIYSHSKYVRCVRIQYVYSYVVLMEILGNCNILVSLALVMCRIGRDFEEDILRWPKLKKLSLKNSLLVQGGQDLMIPFEKLKYLRSLTLSDFGLSLKNCKSLLQCKYLNCIHIEKIRHLNVDFIMALISTKQEILEEFHIYGGDAVNDECLKMLSRCPLLKDLGVIRCENLTDAGLIALTNLTNTLHLQLWNNNNFTEANLLRTLRHPNLTKLTSLSLSRISNVSPVIVDVISEYYKDLKFLAMYQCPKIVNTDYEKQLKSKFRNIDVVLY